jgi:hypothetical protein
MLNRSKTSISILCTALQNSIYAAVPNGKQIPISVNFRAKKLLSSGVVEGLNNKAKVTMRKSSGFRTFRTLELALYHSLGTLPEPDLTTNS